MTYTMTHVLFRAAAIIGFLAAASGALYLPIVRRIRVTQQPACTGHCVVQTPHLDRWACSGGDGCCPDAPSPLSKSNGTVLHGSCEGEPSSDERMLPGYILLGVGTVTCLVSMLCVTVLPKYQSRSPAQRSVMDNSFPLLYSVEPMTAEEVRSLTWKRTATMTSNGLTDSNAHTPVEQGISPLELPLSTGPRDEPSPLTTTLATPVLTSLPALPPQPTQRPKERESKGQGEAVPAAQSQVGKGGGGEPKQPDDAPSMSQTRVRPAHHSPSARGPPLRRVVSLNLTPAAAADSAAAAARTRKSSVPVLPKFDTKPIERADTDDGESTVASSEDSYAGTAKLVVNHTAARVGRRWKPLPRRDTLPVPRSSVNALDL